MRILWLKRRDYPIKRDEYGRSARRQAFEFFNEGYRPAQISKENLVPISLTTLFRYYEDWKKPRNRVSYSSLKRYLKGKMEFSEQYIKMLADYFKVPPQDIILRMQKPWGLMQLSKGELPDDRLERIRSEIEDRLEAALRIIRLAEMFGNSPEQVNQLVSDIVTLENNTELVIRKTEGQVVVRKENI